MAKTKLIVTQLLWLLVCFSTTLLAISMFLQWHPQYDLVQVNIGNPVVYHDVDFFFAGWLFFTFVVFSIKEWLFGYLRTIPNILILGSGALFIYSFSYLQGVYTNYPSGAPLGQDENSSYQRFQLLLWTLRMVVLFWMPVVIVKWHRGTRAPLQQPNEYLTLPAEKKTCPPI